MSHDQLTRALRNDWLVALIVILILREVILG